MPETVSSTTWETSDSLCWRSKENPTTLLAKRAEVNSSAGTINEAVNPSTGSMMMSTIATTTNMTRFADVMGAIARISLSWLRSDEALAINSPVDVTSWNEKARRWMCVKMLFLRSASARYDILKPKYLRMEMPTAWIAPARTIRPSTGQISDMSARPTTRSITLPTR